MDTVATTTPSRKIGQSPPLRHPPLHCRRVTMPSLHLLPLLLPTILAAGAATWTSASPASACRSSFYPKLCRALLTPLRPPSTRSAYDYGRYSVKQSLKQAQKTSRLLEHYLSGGRGGARRAEDGGALEDCRELASLNEEYLQAVQAELGPDERLLSRAGADRVRSLMSALVTNQQTCHDGLLQASGTPFPEIYGGGALSNETSLYGLSLELVSTALDRKGWGEKSGSAGPAAPAAGFHGPETGRRLADGDVSTLGMSRSVVVAQDGTGNFTTVGDAVASAPNGTSAEDGYFAIVVGPGVYVENVVVPKSKKNLLLLGSGVDRTVITGSRNCIDGWTTYNSATFAVHGEGFIAMDVTFENTAGPEKHQAVAVRNSADLSSFYRCRFLGYQDTLYAHSLRQFYRDCEVRGTVDFVFGNAAAVLQGCSIVARRPLPGQRNVATAQGRTHPSQATGTSVHNCSIGAEGEGEGTGTFLGRPWKEYSRTVVMQSYVEGGVEPAGWLEWNGTFALGTLFYGEFENTGPGADTSRRVPWEGYRRMDVTEAWNFTVYNFTTGDAWLPSTPVPYSGGLLFHL